MANSRGLRIRDAIGSFDEALATTSRGRWDEYEAGVFSHSSVLISRVQMLILVPSVVGLPCGRCKRVALVGP